VERGSDNRKASKKQSNTASRDHKLDGTGVVKQSSEAIDMPQRVEKKEDEKEKQTRIAFQSTVGKFSIIWT